MPPAVCLLDAETVARGARLYAEFCAACHGAALEGEAEWRMRRDDGGLRAPPHDASGHTWHHPDAQLFAITKYGTEAVTGGAVSSDMQGFGDLLSDAEIGAGAGLHQGAMAGRDHRPPQCAEPARRGAIAGSELRRGPGQHRVAAGLGHGHQRHEEQEAGAQHPGR